MDEFKNLNGNGELFGDNPDDNKVKIDFGSIESTESGIALEEKFGAAQEFDFESTPVAEEKAEYAEEMIPQEQTVVAQQPPVVQVPAQPMPDQPEPAKKQKTAKKSNKSAEAKKAKKAKQKKNFGIFIRVFIITILSVVTLWTVVYTVDHVLAAQGYAPVFALEKTKYDILYLSDENEILKSNGYKEDDLMYAYSYECLGYKIQHIYDENCNPEVDFIWAWEKGAVDELYDRGELFKP